MVVCGLVNSTMPSSLLRITAEARQALAAAITWRDAKLAKIAALTKAEFHQCPRSNNTSGTPGVISFRRRIGRNGRACAWTGLHTPTYAGLYRRSAQSRRSSYRSEARAKTLTYAPSLIPGRVTEVEAPARKSYPRPTDRTDLSARTSACRPTATTWLRTGGACLPPLVRLLVLLLADAGSILRAALIRVVRHLRLSFCTKFPFAATVMPRRSAHVGALAQLTIDPSSGKRGVGQTVGWFAGRA
jgi:hypothetical protein